MVENALKITNLSGGYKDKKIFENLDLDIEKGSFCAIAGPNGAGKSTLLKFIIREIKPGKGSVEVFSNNIGKLSQIEIANYVSFVGQNPTRDYEFTVSELVEMGRFCHENSNENMVDEALEKAGILHLKNCLVTKISGGEFQLAMIGRAICQDSPIILLDEPTNNLDPYYQNKILSLLKNLAEKGKTVVCVMHDLNSVLTWCTDTVLIKDGKVFAQGKTEDVLTEKNISAVYNVDCRFVYDFSPECGRKPLIVYYNR